MSLQHNYFFTMGDGPKSKTPNPLLNPPEAIQYTDPGPFSHSNSKAEGALLQAEATEASKAYRDSKTS